MRLKRPLSFSRDGKIQCETASAINTPTAPAPSGTQQPFRASTCRRQDEDRQESGRSRLDALHGHAPHVLLPNPCRRDEHAAQILKVSFEVPYRSGHCRSKGDRCRIVNLTRGRCLAMRSKICYAFSRLLLANAASITRWAPRRGLIER
jgi:hypothetical protein